MTYSARLGYGGDYNIYNFPKEEAFTVTVQKSITESMVESIIVNGFEGGIRYWCSRIGDNLADGTPIREGKPIDMPISQWCTHLILGGKSVPMFVYEEKNPYYLNREGIQKGLAYWMSRNPDFEIGENDDAGDADGIIQYALFGKIVYG